MTASESTGRTGRVEGHDPTSVDLLSMIVDPMSESLEPATADHLVSADLMAMSLELRSPGQKHCPKNQRHLKHHLHVRTSQKMSVETMSVLAAETISVVVHRDDDTT